MGSGAGKLNNTESKVQAVAAFKGKQEQGKEETKPSKTMPVLQETQEKHDLSKFSDASKQCFEDIKNELKYFGNNNSLWSDNGQVKICQELADKSAILLKYQFKLRKMESNEKMKEATMVHTGVIYKELDVIVNIVKLMIDMWNIGFSTGDEENDVLVLTLFRSHMGVFQTLTYYDPVISEALCEAGFLEGLAQWLGDLQEKHLNQTGNEIEEKFVLACLANSNNCSSHGHLTKSYFDDLNYVDVLVPYLQTPNNYYRTSCTICLAYLVDESRNDIFSSDLSHIKYLVNLLHATLDPNLRSYGWTAGTLSKGIAKLAVNDENKKNLVDAGILPHLVKMAELKDKDDVLAALQLLWALSFHPENKKKMKADKSVVNTLETLAKSDDKKLNQEAEGCMWTLGLVQLQPATADFLSGAVGGLAVSKLKKAAKKGDQKEKGSSDKKETINDSGPHVMISYNWTDQQMMKQIKKQLNQIGFRVWLDVEQMEGSTLQAMASAVEKSVVILICMSQKYKDSPNCRAEAEYAFQQRKEIIPLVMQRKYRADGWLGMIAGTKLFYDFSGKYSFESRLDGLLKELSEKGKPACNDTAAVKVLEPVTTASPSKDSSEKKASKCSTWSISEVQKWIKDLSLKSEKGFSGIDGEQLCFLQEMQERAPEFYFGYLERHLKLTELKDLMTFDKALMKLTR